MSLTIQQLKSGLRSAVRAELKKISSDTRAAASLSASELVRIQTEWQNARSILFYAPLPDELDLSTLWDIARAENKTVALPRFISEESGYAPCRVPDLSNGLVQGRFGVMEPCGTAEVIAGNQLDLAFIPGVAFDLNGRRLGRGKGFYDRLLESMSAIKCGVAYDEQIRPEIPVEPHDMMLDCLVTPTRWFRFRNRSAWK